MMDMKDKIGNIGIVTDRSFHTNTIFVVCKEEFAQMVGKYDGWSNMDGNTLEVMDITERVFHPTLEFGAIDSLQSVIAQIVAELKENRV